jgi:hypothetical protein
VTAGELGASYWRVGGGSGQLDVAAVASHDTLKRVGARPPLKSQMKVRRRSAKRKRKAVAQGGSASAWDVGRLAMLISSLISFLR